MRTRFIKVALVSTVALMGAMSTQAKATVYDAVNDFSISQNPNGPWAYGTGTGGSTFALMPNAESNGFAGPNFQYWQVSNPVYSVPLIGKNIGGSTLTSGTVVIPTGELLIHPGQATDVIVQWTAPTAGTYSYAGGFELLDINPTGVIGEVFKDGTQLYSGLLTGPGADQATLTPGQAESFAGLVTLNAGDTLSFVVNNDGNFLDDSTGLTATISAVPLPAALPMFGAVVAGLGGLAAMRRRAAAKA